MGKRCRYRDHPDPEYQRWGRKYPHFPGVAECVRLIREGKTRGAWTDLIANELAENAGTCMAELIEVFRTTSCENVRLHIMMALEIALQPESVSFLAEVLQAGNPLFTPYALRTISALGHPGTHSQLPTGRHH